MADEKEKEKPGDGDGDDEGKALSVSVTPVFTALFKPSADYLGKELKAGLKATVEAAKKHIRNANVVEHIRKAFANRSEHEKRAGETVHQLELFEKWADGAQDVEPDDSPLA